MYANTTLANDYTQANKLRAEIDEALKASESKAHTIASQQRLTAMVNEFSQLVLAMETKIDTVSTKSQSDLWKRRIANLTNDASEFRELLSKLFGESYRGEKIHLERRALLGNSARKGAQTAEENALHQKKSLQSSLGLLDDIINQGSSIFSNLNSQTISLTNVKAKTSNLFDSLSTTNSVLGLIGRRHRQDKYIIYLLMFVTIVFFFSLWYFFRKK